MPRRTLERAAVAAVVLSLAFVAVVSADTVIGDADPSTGGNQGEINLGDVTPNAVLSVPVAFTLNCSNSEHVGPGQSVLVEFATGSVPDDGIFTMDPVTIGPAPDTWPADGDGCSGTEEPLTASGTAMITAPSTLGPHTFSIMFDRTISPAGDNDGSALSGVTALDFDLTVVEDTTPPELHDIPGNIEVFSDDPEGAVATWTDPTATDDLDPNPTVECVPPSGSVFPQGTTTVTCTATDASGNAASASFDVTVGPEPAPPAEAATAVFGPPFKNGELTGHAGRTIPMKVRLMSGDVSVGTGELILVVTPCEGGDPVAELEMDWREGSQRWFGHLGTRGWEPGCYDVRAMHDGVDVGGAVINLFGKGKHSETAEASAKVKAEKGPKAKAEKGSKSSEASAKGAKGGKHGD